MLSKIREYERKIIDLILGKYWPFVIMIFSTVVWGMMQRKGLSLKSGDWIYHYSLWFQEMKDNGGLLSLDRKIGDYPEGFNLLLAFLTHLPTEPLLSFKLLVILFHLISAVAAYFLVRIINVNTKRSKYVSSVAYSAVLILPSLVLNTAVWGQVDSIWLGFLLVALCLLVKEKYAAAFLLVGIALSMKQTAIFILPALALIYLRNNKVSVLHFANVLIGYLVVSLPALVMGKSLKDVIGSYLGYGSGITNVVVANFTNVYALMTPYPLWSNWIANPMITHIGSWFFIFVIGLTILVLHYKKVEIGGNDTLLIATMFVVMTCNFLPGIHDRYMLLADVLSILYVISSGRMKDIWIPIYINFVSAFNLMNYLHGVSDAVSSTRIILVQIVSIGFLAISLYFFYFVYKQFLRKGGVANGILASDKKQAANYTEGF